MKALVRQTGFVVAVFVAWLILFSPLHLILEQLFPLRRSPDGLYRQNNPGMISLLVGLPTLWVANRVVGWLGQTLGFTPERWSIFTLSRLD